MRDVGSFMPYRQVDDRHCVLNGSGAKQTAATVAGTQMWFEIHFQLQRPVPVRRTGIEHEFGVALDFHFLKWHACTHTHTLAHTHTRTHKKRR